jgi:hypothetical protein
MSEDRLAEIAARVDETRIGPWTLHDANEGDGWPPREFWVVATASDDEDDWSVEIHTGDKEVGEFIATARQDVPELLAEVRRLRANQAEAVKAIESSPEAFLMPASQNMGAALALLRDGDAR